jgi:hypothetical protein
MVSAPSFPLGGTGLPMPDYGEILAFLAANPPEMASERELHASLLELLAKCLRSEETAENADDLLEDLKPLRIPRADFN